MISPPVVRLSTIARQLLPGQRFMFDQPDGRTFAAIWPNPQWPTPDDYLTPADRAARWAERLGVRVWEQLDPLAVVVERPEIPARLPRSGAAPVVPLAAPANRAIKGAT